MFSKSFFAWVGVGILGVATIPVIAAPHLAKFAARPAAAEKSVVAKAPVKAKPAVAAKAKPAAATKSVAAPAKLAAAARPAAKTTTTSRKMTTASAHAKSLVARHPAPKKLSASSTKPGAKKPTPASTAKKLLH
jgi:hypothetical protein